MPLLAISKRWLWLAPRSFPQTLPCFVRRTQSSLTERRACETSKSLFKMVRSFRVHRRVRQEFVLGPVLFSFPINNLPATPPSSDSRSLYVDDQFM